MSKILTFTYCFLLVISFATQAQVPSGFADVAHSSNWQNPTGLTFDSNGKMYVWEKEGRVYVVENNNKSLFIDISGEVATYGDYGILGFALDPNFINNGHVYLYYVVDRHHLLFFGTPDYDSNVTWEGATIARVTRYTTPAPASTNSVDYNSRLVLLGETKSSGIPITGTNHGGGGIAFGNDGSLFVSSGDGGLGVDYDDEALNDEILSPAENVEDRVYRCQMLNSLNGKLIRINAANGDGMSDNPHFDSNAPRAAQSRVWALGLRNPFRISVKPNSGNPGVVYIGEVGWNRREELDIATTGGQNFGWPIYEGNDLPTIWSNPIYTPASYKKPTVEWIHPDAPTDLSARVIINDMEHTVGSSEFPGENFTGTCMIGGVWYTGTTYPEEFRNTYIFADFVPGWIKSFSFDGNQNPTAFRNLHASALGAVSLAYNPVDESIYYVKLGFSEGDPMEVRKIVYNLGANLAPKARFTATPKSGNSPLTVDFNASSSTDPENTNLTYDWDFGNGQTATGQTPSHIFDNGSTTPQAYKVMLTVSDEGGLSDTTSTFISLNNTAPTISSTSVDAINLFANNGSDLIALSAQVTDNEEPNNQLTYRWTVRLHHDEHSHPALDVTRETSQVNLEIVPCDGHLYFYRVVLKVSDSYGLTTTFTKDIYPSCGTPDNTPPDEPFLKLSDIGNNNFRLSWNNVTDNQAVGSYEIFVNGTSQATVTPQTLTYQYSSASNIMNQNFECYVKAIDLSGNFNTSSRLSFIATSSSTNSSQIYLSDINEVTGTNGFGPYEKDKSNGENAAGDGSTITLNGVAYSKGLGTHAVSEIVYNLTPNEFNTFSAKIGIDDEIPFLPNAPCGKAVFKVYKDNTLAYQSPVMTPASPTIPIDIDISGGSQLKIVADISGGNNYCAHADWADAKLMQVVSSDIVPPTTPTNLAANATIVNNYTLFWNASIDNVSSNVLYEITVNAVVVGTTTNLQYTVPVQNSGTYVVAVQAKDNANNRAASSSISLLYMPCVPTLNVTDNFTNTAVELKTSQTISASNVILGASKVMYQAAKSIEFLPGFSATAGSVFKAQIGGCNN